MTGNKVTSKKHNGIISFWKFCFCMMIVFFHGRIFASDNDFVILARGSIGVEFFFLVSGFLLAKSALNKVDEENHKNLGKETINFVMKKFITFLPYVLYGGIISLIIQNVFNHIGIYKNIISTFDIFMLRMTGLRCTVVVGPVWYISAMLLSMLLLYPLLRKYKHNFLYIFAPLIVLLGFGWLSHTYSNLRDPDLWTGLVYKGLIRGFLELTLGCILYVICQKLKDIDFTKLGKILITIIEIFGFVITFLVSQFYTKTAKYDFVILAFLSISILLAFSEKTLEFKSFNNKVFYWLEKFSLPLYICNTLSRDFIESSNWFTSMSYFSKLSIYLLITFILSLICMYLIDYLKSKNFFLDKLKKLIIKESSL